MKKVIAVVTVLLLLAFAMPGAMAQDKMVVKIAQVHAKAGMVLFTLSGSRPFIFANNHYMLYIGSTGFKRAQQSSKSGKGTLTFMIPRVDFETLGEGDAMYVTYGEHDPADEDMEALAKHTRKAWSIGKFRKSLLTK